jgi:hypothetical protein
VVQKVLVLFVPPFRFAIRIVLLYHFFDFFYSSSVASGKFATSLSVPFFLISLYPTLLLHVATFHVEWFLYLLFYLQKKKQAKPGTFIAACTS